MYWVTITWSTVAAACFTLAAVHVLIWLKQRTAWGHLLFSLNAVSAAVTAGFELALMHAQSPQQYGVLLRWAHIPFWFLIVSLVWFIRVYLGAGRGWLAWSVVGLRTLALALNFIFAPNLNFRQITLLRRVTLLGERVSIIKGVTNPWTLVGQSSSVLLLIFVLDAMVTVWRRGDHRRAMTICGSICLFVTVASSQLILVAWGIVHTPLLISITYLGFVAAMAYELVTDVHRSTGLARQLQANQTELHDKEQRMDLAASTASLAMWIWDIVKDEVWISEAGRKSFGNGNPGKISLERLLETVAPEDRQSVRHAIASSMNGDGDYETEFRVPSANGQLRWMAGRVRVEFDQTGKPLRMLGSSIDITSRKQTEESLRESEARFRELANAAPVMIWMAGTDKLCTFFNKGWLIFTGRSLEQELGNGWAQGVHHDDYDRCLQNYIASFDARLEFAMEYRLRRADGEYRCVLDTGVPRLAADGTFLGYIGSAVDITELKRAEDRFRQVVEAAPNAMIVVSAHGEIALVNRQAEAVFGYPREELVGQPIEILVPESLRDAHPDHRLNYLEDPKARATGAGRELFGRRKDGSTVPVEIGLSPINTAQGSFVLASVIDISARRQAELEVRQQRAELAHLSRVTMLGELSGSLAHELNQPLTAILSNAQAAQRFLAHEVADLDEVRAILKDIVDDDNRAGQVIRRLRLLLKKGELDCQILDVNDAIFDVLKLVNSDLMNHNVIVQTDFKEDLPAISADRVQFQQVILNLIMNGCDAMADTPVSDRKLVLRTALPDEAGVEISVTDRGCGIPRERLEQVFTPFFTTKSDGMGLGLAVCRTIISAHGGRLWATNEIDRGTSFHVSLPAAVAEGVV